MPYHNSVIQMRRALVNSMDFEASSDTGIPPFNPNDIDGWDEMTPQEQQQVEEIYHSFEKLAHLMEDWATEFEEDMAKYDDDGQVPVTANGYGRPDTGSRTEQGWRRRGLTIEGTTRHSGDPTTTDGEDSYRIHDDSYVPVGTNPYPEEPRKHTVMDDSNDQTRAPQNPAVPKLHKPVPNEIDLSDSIRKAPKNPGPAPQWEPVEQPKEDAPEEQKEPKTHIEWVSAYDLPGAKKEWKNEVKEWNREATIMNQELWAEQIQHLGAYSPWASPFQEVAAAPAYNWGARPSIYGNRWGV